MEVCDAVCVRDAVTEDDCVTVPVWLDVCDDVDVELEVIVSELVPDAVDVVVCDLVSDCEGLADGDGDVEILEDSVELRVDDSLAVVVSDADTLALGDTV